VIVLYATMSQKTTRLLIKKDRIRSYKYGMLYIPNKEKFWPSIDNEDVEFYSVTNIKKNEKNNNVL
jgi:hypothetical protein